MAVNSFATCETILIWLNRYFKMDEVDREASTKESEDEGTVNRECVTVESDGM